MSQPVDEGDAGEQAQCPAGSDATPAEPERYRARIASLEWEVHELRQANGILIRVANFLALSAPRHPR